MCIYEEAPCVKDWMRVCGDGKREVKEGDVGYDLSMNMCFLLVPFCVLFLLSHRKHSPWS